MPLEPAGPYPLDLSLSSTMFRQDIRDGQAGVPIKMKIRIVNDAITEPILNARVDVWHCNANGNYSGYVTSGHTGGQQYYRGQTLLRDIQLTDPHGEVEFTTVSPGWYRGRATHMHFQIFLTSVLHVTSQIAFPDATSLDIYTTAAPYSDYQTDSTDYG